MGFGSNPFPVPSSQSEFLRVDIQGEKDIIRALNQLGPRIERKVMRTALTKAGRILAKEAKNILKSSRGEFRDSHGILWRSIGVKTKTTRAGITYAVIGPQRRRGRWIVPIADKRKKGRVRFKAMTSQQAARSLLSGQTVGGLSATRRERTGKGGMRRRQFRNPTKYAHLIEFGTARSAKHPFMRPAWSRFGGDIALGKIRSELKKQIPIEARKVAAKAKR